MRISVPSNDDGLRFAKARQGQPAPRGADSMQPYSGARRGLDASAAGRIGWLDATSAGSQQQRLWRTWQGDADVFAMLLKPAYLLPPWRLDEVEEGAGSDAELEILKMFFHRPDGRLSFSAILWVTAVRLTALGEAHWLLRRNPDPIMDDQQSGTVTTRLLKQIEQKDPGLWKAFVELGDDGMSTMLARVAQDVQGVAKRPIGFEWMQGAVMRKPNDPTRFVQQVGQIGKKDYPQEDVVEFVWPNPATGKGLNLLEALEPYSNASVQVMVMNRDAARTGGMADLALVIPGISPAERMRLEALMLDRADPARSDEYYVPIVVRQETMPDERTPAGAYSVELSRKGRDMTWTDFDDRLVYRKSGITGVSAALTGRYKDVNRSNMEEQRRQLFEERVGPLTELVADNVNEQILVEQFGIESWELGFEEVDLRSEEFAQRQDTEQFADGTLTWADRYLKKHGKTKLDDMLERLQGLGANVNLLRTPLMKSGQNLVWLADLAKVKPEEASAAAGLGEQFGESVLPALAHPAKPSAGEPPLPVKTGEESPPAQAGVDVAGAATTPGLGKALESLDAWQKHAAQALRENGFAEAEWQAATARQYLAADLWEWALEKLEQARTVVEVSDVFAPLRKGLRDAELLMSKAVQVDPGIAADLQDGLLTIYAERRQRIARELQTAAEEAPGLGDFEVTAPGAEEVTP